jgi:hypothetical protein
VEVAGTTGVVVLKVELGRVVEAEVAVVKVEVDVLKVTVVNVEVAVVKAEVAVLKVAVKVDKVALKVAVKVDKVALKMVVVAAVKVEVVLIKAEVAVAVKAEVVVAEKAEVVKVEVAVVGLLTLFSPKLFGRKLLLWVSCRTRGPMQLPCHRLAHSVPYPLKLLQVIVGSATPPRMNGGKEHGRPIGRDAPRKFLLWVMRMTTVALLMVTR